MTDFQLVKTEKMRTLRKAAPVGIFDSLTRKASKTSTMLSSLSLIGRSPVRMHAAKSCLRAFSSLDPPKSGRVVVVSSGKGGVGKTTTAASFAMGLSEKGFKVVAIDFDIGLRNLDIHLGCERRVIFDFVNVLQKECTLNQALIKDKKCSNLYILAASQTKDKDILTVGGVGELFGELRKQFE